MEWSNPTIVQQMDSVAFVGKPRRVARNTVRYMNEAGDTMVRYHFTDVGKLTSTAGRR